MIFFFIIYRTILGSQLARSLLYHTALSWLLIKSQLKYIVFSGLLDNLYNERKSKKSRSCNWKNNVIEMALKFLSDSMEEGGINWIINNFNWNGRHKCSILLIVHLVLMLFFVDNTFPICPLNLFNLNGPIMTMWRIIYLRGQL